MVIKANIKEFNTFLSFFFFFGRKFGNFFEKEIGIKIYLSFFIVLTSNFKIFKNM